MHTKLTLTLEDGVIRLAKKYARSRETSLSRMVQSYFSSLAAVPRQKAPLPPITASLAGMIHGPVTDHTETLTDALVKKYL